MTALNPTKPKPLVASPGRPLQEGSCCGASTSLFSIGRCDDRWIESRQRVTRCSCPARITPGGIQNRSIAGHQHHLGPPVVCTMFVTDAKVYASQLGERNAFIATW